MASTLFLLMAEFGVADIPVEIIAKKYLNLGEDLARRKASQEKLPFPSYKLGSSKSQRFVRITDLAEWLDFEREKGIEEWEKRNVG